ncbi:MAG: Ig-like domain-containing protein [Planctomycetota bacterium]
MDVTNVQDAPTAANSTVTATEDTTYTFTAGDFSYTDVDGDAMTQIQVTSLESVGDLQLDGVDVTLNQVITKADIDAGKLKFIPVGDANGVGYDAFNFKVHDGTEYSASGYSMTVDVNAVNDLPTAADNTITINEDTPHTFSAADFGFSDVDAGDTLTKIQISILESNGTLKLSGVDVTVGQEILVGQIPNLVYTPAQDQNGAGYDSFQFKVHDGTEYSASQVASVLINSDFAAGADGFTYVDNAFGTSNYPAASGSWDAAVGSGGGGGLEVALAYTGFWGDGPPDGPASGAFTKDITLTSDAWVRITFDYDLIISSEYEADEYGEAIFEVDGTRYGSDTNNSLVHLVGDGNGGAPMQSGYATHTETIYLTSGSHTLAFGAYNNKATLNDEWSDAHFDNIVVEELVDYTVTVDVTAVNDAPTSADKTVTTNEDTGYTFAAADFGFSDVDAGDSLTKIQITSLESNGTLKLSGVDVTLNQEILVADIGNLVFTPAQDANGTGYDTFDFKVHDGLEYSVAANTITVDVTAVQDAPTAADNTVTTNEDTGYTFAAADFGFSDVDSGDSLTKIQITSLESAGTLKLSGADVTLNQEILVADIGNLVFTPAQDANGASYDSFDFNAANTITVDVTAVQDAPTAADKTVTTNEDTGYTFSAADFGFSDVDAGDSLTKIQITSLESNGTLKLSGADVTLNQEILVADIGNLVFTPAQDANGASYDSFDFKVHDGTEYSAAANTITGCRQDRHDQRGHQLHLLGR